jgi:PST family polysaccharide transporter
LVGGVALARVLSPADFGVYAVATLLLSFLLVFGDAGLGVALVRQSAAPTSHQLRQVFSVQQLIVSLLAGTGLLMAGHLAQWYDLRDGDALVFRLACLAVLVQSFQTVPMLLLERRLAFPRLGLVSVLEVVVFNLVAVSLAYAGLGVTSIGVALVVQACAGVVLAQVMSPWVPRWTADLSGVRELLSFSLPYQGIGVVSLIKDSVAPVLIGLTAGAASVGYVTWAQSFAAFAVLALMSLTRLYLPVYARLQHDRERLGRAVELTMRATSAVTAPLAVLTLVLAEPITDIVYGDKWRPGLPVFYLLWTANLWVPAATPLLGLLNAVGRSRSALGMTVLWMLATWTLTPPLVAGLGLKGYGIANALVQLTNVALFRLARTEAHFSILRACTPAWLAAGLAGVVMLGLRLLWPVSGAPSLLTYAGAGMLVYAVALVLLERAHLQMAWRLVRA